MILPYFAHIRNFGKVRTVAEYRYQYQYGRNASTRSCSAERLDDPVNWNLNIFFPPLSPLYPLSHFSPPLSFISSVPQSSHPVVNISYFDQTVREASLSCNVGF